ncbi:hypothetical protein HHI36_012942 [Cryptolaemus montrouzieri]|uniref:Uncharacterized protein n=1 Tax=Cryptolaemus montrouzieri TaxID=559131 RepID=A0ABD2NGC9_9CUCU
MKDIAIDTAKEISMVLCKLTQHDASPPEKPNLQSVFLQSPCSSSSTSRETSPSTVRLKTLNTSIADVASILTDLELAKEVSTFKQPLELRQMCLNFLLSLPCGAEILQELSDLALNLDKLTQMLNPSKKLLKNARLSSDFELNNSESIPEKHMWSGQNRKSFHTSEDMKNEPDILFDLHTKFLERENSSLLEKQFRKSIEITSIQTETMENRSDITYSVTSSKTLPKNFKHSPNNARLSASNLDEWLNFAREDKNMPEINAKEEDNKELRNRFKHEEMKVPNELYHRQMQLILEKEREIQKELEQLLEEKRKLCLEIEGSDIEAQNKKTRPKSFPPAISESFRQQMFEEYKKQIEEREDRKHNKVIKITSSPGIKSEEGEKPKVEVTHVTGIEDEFMKKVQELHGIPSEIEEEETLVEKNEECEPVLLIDGNRLKESTTDLPKHLREFVEITSNSSVSDSTEGESA